jgi:AAA15 family ATPase/GTPase
MKLEKITIENFRSIENQIFTVGEIDSSSTFILIGVNETGKSSFLKAISLIDSEEKIRYPQDFYDDNKPISICLTYRLDSSDLDDLHKSLSEKGFEKRLLSKISVAKNVVNVCLGFEPKADTARQLVDRFEFKKTTFVDYTLSGESPARKDPAQTQNDFDLRSYFQTYFGDFFWKKAHVITFWKSSDQYLINEKIDLNTFADKPEEVSIPLKNCFNLAGIVDVKAEITKVQNDPGKLKALEEKLSDKVTAHIKSVWPKHPIKIKFRIDGMQLSFLVEDEGVEYQSQTTRQRSDGFRQFVSFLLTVSAENVSGQLSRTLLLLDEPEAHLHPQAQEFLLGELIKITSSKVNNIVFFATHSSYMIDKDHLGRSFRFTKVGNKKTQIDPIEEKKTSYAEVNYEVFGIPTADYHNELYGYLQDTNQSGLDRVAKGNKWKNKKTGSSTRVSLPEYIRHSIHHPENKLNRAFTRADLERSINILRKLKYG